MGPALETFIQALLIVALVVTPIVLLLRKPAARLYSRLCEQDRKELADLHAREQDRKAQEEARRMAALELERDCYPAAHADPDSSAQTTIRSGRSPEAEDPTNERTGER